MNGRTSIPTLLYLVTPSCSSPAGAAAAIPAWRGEFHGPASAAAVQACERAGRSVGGGYLSLAALSLSLRKTKKPEQKITCWEIDSSPKVARLVSWDEDDASRIGGGVFVAMD